MGRVPLVLRILALVIYLFAMGMVAVYSFALYRHYSNFPGEVVGDPKLADAVEKRRFKWGIRQMSIATIDLNDKKKPIRYAFINAKLDTKFELGTTTQALTGLLVADAIKRRELQLARPLGDQANGLSGPIAAQTLQALVTHRSALPKLPASMWPKTVALHLFGLNPFPKNGPDIVATASKQGQRKLEYRASSLGAALAGQIVAHKAGLSFEQTLQTRLLDPLGMPDTSVSPANHQVKRGWTGISRRAFPWAMDGYAPAAGAVSNIIDMATLARTTLSKQAVGAKALDPLAPRKAEWERIGMFWHVESVGGQTLAYLSGKSGGYSAFIGLVPRKNRAVVILSNVATPHSNSRLGSALVAWMNGAPDPEPTGFAGIRKPSDLLTLYGFKRR